MEVKLARTTSVFGAALASMLVAPELQAEIVDLTFSQSSVMFGGVGVIGLNEVGGIFLHYNLNFGRTMFIVAGLDNIRTVGLSSILSPNTFTGAISIPFTAGSSTTNYVGFITLGGNVGWFSFSVAGPGTAINYLEGRYGNAGESVHVPSPGALALLALGAVGIRRKRKRAA